MESFGSSRHRAQVGALPVRGEGECLEVLLITSRDTGRWIIPKGWPMKGKKDHDAAAQEAFEEGGVVGKVHPHPIGAYVYEKGSSAGSEMIRVMVYRLEVSAERKDWPEKSQRIRRWMASSKAAGLVKEAGLSEILLRLASVSDRHPGDDFREF